MIVTIEKVRESIKTVMIAMQFQPNSREEVEEMIRIYHIAFAHEEMTVEKLNLATKTLVVTWRPEFGRKFPSVADFLDSAGLSVDRIAKEALAWLKMKKTAIGQYSNLEIKNTKRSFVLISTLDSLGGWVRFCSMNQHEENAFCAEFLDRYKKKYMTGDYGRVKLKALGSSDSCAIDKKYLLKSV